MPRLRRPSSPEKQRQTDGRRSPHRRADIRTAPKSIEWRRCASAAAQNGSPWINLAQRPGSKLSGTLSRRRRVSRRYLDLRWRQAVRGIVDAGARRGGRLGERGGGARSRRGPRLPGRRWRCPPPAVLASVPAPSRFGRIAQIVGQAGVGFIEHLELALDEALEHDLA